MTDISDMERIEELRASEKEERQAWDQLPNEPTKEYDLFQRFLAQGPQAQDNQSGPYGGRNGERGHAVPVFAQVAVEGEGRVLGPGPGAAD